MNEEIEYFLKQGPHTAADLARLTGLSKSTVHNNLKAEGVLKKNNPNGPGNYYYMGEVVKNPQEANKAPQSTPSPKKTKKVAPATTSGAGKEKPEQKVKGKQGRKSALLGKKLMITVPDNPRCTGSHGHRSWQIVADNPAIATEDYLAKGGRLNDLRWDLAHGYVEASDF